MKQKKQLQKYIAVASLALALIGSAGLALAAQDIQLLPTGIQMNGDPNDTNPGPWGTYWITTSTNATCTFAFDPTMHSDPSIPGSIYCVCDWNGGGKTDINFGAVLPNGNGTWLGNPAIQVIDGTQYAYLKMDVFWTNVTGLTSWPTIGLMTPSYGMVNITNDIAIPSTPGWQHYNIAIDPALPNLSSIAGFMFYRWQDDSSVTHAEFWVDNIQLIARAVAVPPPTLSPLTKPVPGLEFIAASGGQYDRQEIRTVGTNYAWYGASGPVSYSVNVVKIGENAPAPTGFTLFMHFVPGIPNPNDGSSDYAEPNVVMWTISNSADGSAWSQLRYKTNAPVSNGHMFDTGSFPGGVWNPTPAGTWTITFSQDTNIVITAPTGGAITNILPPEVVDIFKNYSPNMQINVGGVPGDLSRLGQMAVVTEVKITGTPGEPNVDSNFLTQPRDTNVWGIVAASPVGVQQVPTDAAYWLKWTLPYTGFGLQTKATLDSGAWTDLTISGYDGAGFHSQLLLNSDLPGTNAGFFRLSKPVASQLQVLLPGETNASGTVTGKIGTPDPQTVGAPFDIIVNACDATWHIAATSSDIVHITSTDTSAGLPTDAPMVNGTVTFSSSLNPFYFGSSGTWTITASDVTTNAVKSGTSTPITIP
jgi:hypothetical protein